MRLEPVSSIGSETGPLGGLSARQRQCLDLVAKGLSSAEVGRRLGVSSRTVDEHVAHACDILGVRTRVQAVVILVSSARRFAEPRSFLP